MKIALSDAAKRNLLRARAVAYDEGFKGFCGDLRERDNPYVGNLKEPWAQGWNDAKRQYKERQIEEAQRADTDGAEQLGVGLTHKS